jgi:hypothetical protein
MRSSSSTGNPSITAATAVTNESLKTAYEGEVLDESDIEHLFQIFVEASSSSSLNRNFSSNSSRKKDIDGRPQQLQRRFDISGSNLVGDGSYYIADCFLTYRDYEYDLIDLRYTLLQLKGK